MFLVFDWTECRRRDRSRGNVENIRTGVKKNAGRIMY